MKFEQIKNLQEPEKHYSQKEVKKENLDTNIKSFCRYGELAIIVMQPNTKGSLRELSTLINDGKKPCSWTCRITLYKNEWVVALAPHDKVNKENIKINVYEEVSKSFPEANGNLHTCFYKTKDYTKVESIVNYIISIFYNNDLNVDDKINSSFIIKNSSGPFSLNYSENKNIDAKNKALIDCILKHNIEEKEKLQNISEEELNLLALKYCSEKERLHIAIKFMD